MNKVQCLSLSVEGTERVLIFKWTVVPADLPLFPFCNERKDSGVPNSTAPEWKLSHGIVEL